MQIPLLIAFARSACTYANKVLGSHADLVARGGRYAEMYETWISQTDVAGHPPAA